jgi:hypothetical protein
MDSRIAALVTAAALGAGLACAQTTPTDPPAAGAVPAAPVAPAPAAAAAAATTSSLPPGPASGGPALPATRWSPAQIRQSFDRADANNDGQLTRAEAQRLSILPHSFEDMDQNKDGVVTRAEYEASFNAQ